MRIPGLHKPGRRAATALVLAAALLLACESSDGSSDGGASSSGGDDTAQGSGGDGTTDIVAASRDGSGGASSDVGAPVRTEPERVSVEDARAWMLSDAHDTLLVCAYGSREACADRLLEGAIALPDLEEMKDDLEPTREIVFYCS